MRIPSFIRTLLGAHHDGRELPVGALYATVFLTGAAVLALETIAFRSVAPYFGNTIYSFSSVITVVLLGLSLGYFFGGRLADRRDASSTIFLLLVGAGALASLLFFLHMSYIFAATLYITKSLVSGPLVGSLVAFLLPAFLLGMLSPYATALAARAKGVAAIGSVSGSIFAFSTLGSIVGSVATGFVLIPNISITSIVWWVSTVLAALSFAGLMYTRGAHTLRTICGVIFVLALAWGAGVTGDKSFLGAGDVLVHQEEGRYATISVVDMHIGGVPARVLRLDRDYSSGISHTGRLIFHYAQFQDLVSLLSREPRHALYLGGGSATLAHALLARTSGTAITVVDIEPALPRIAREYFGVQPSPRLSYVIDDARRFLMRSTTTYDFIFSDIFASSYSIPYHVMTVEFYKEIQLRLAQDGIALFNIIGALDGHAPSVIASTARTMAAVFPEVELFAVVSPASSEMQNFVFAVSNSTLLWDRLLSGGAPLASLAHYHNRRVPLLPLLSNERYTIYTDAFAPVEAHMATGLARAEKRESVRR